MSHSTTVDSSTRYNYTNAHMNINNNSNLSCIDPNRYTINLENNGKLLHPKLDYNQEYRNIFNTYGASICCCVLPNTRTIPYYNFESTHFIYFQYKRHKLKKHNNNSFYANNYKTQKRYSYYLLHITFKQLLLIDKLIKQNNISTNKLFTEGYPQCLLDTKRKRTEILDSKYSYEEWLITKPLLPNGPNKSMFGIGKRKSMTFTDLKQYSNYMHKILNNIQLLLNDTLYEILNIYDTEIIILFKILAITKLETLKSEANKYDHFRCLRDPTKLKRKIGINFHTLWIVKRPINDKTAAFVGCDHWALKFEGNDQLMTIGFFKYNQEHGIILSKIVPNTPLNRRLFWYYWPRDNVQQIESQHFNTRWTVLEKLYLGEISCELIGILIEEWLSYDNHAIYDLTRNNCQHFVRDFIAPLNIKIAKRLSSSFDVKVVKAILPAGVLAEGIDSEAKCNNIHKRLWPVLSQYQENINLKKQNENNIDEQKQFEKNFDFIAKQLGIDNNFNDNEIKQEEKEYNDIQNSLTPSIYKTHIDININGNECIDDDDDDHHHHIIHNDNINNKLDIHTMNLSVTPSFPSVENKNNDNDIK